ncbi:uncharacterized protein BP5553_10384 [Venustampulla echinocandica]|uniref:Uncharacterized protein n=1 Tax=Venustampulla echinocandica TaxID=2656787 RepID=A0A370T953_9HELO|nr:uncharacterized protein BP5553_10384 [Venustampulla echinocandica]RDL30106.1 hypothetical protein BP5553_10384 [Venustampulla echinocandica]
MNTEEDILQAQTVGQGNGIGISLINTTTASVHRRRAAPWKMDHADGADPPPNLICTTPSRKGAIHRPRPPASIENLRPPPALYPQLGLSSVVRSV